jgi:hypothetical protein
MKSSLAAECGANRLESGNLVAHRRAANFPIGGFPSLGGPGILRLQEKIIHAGVLEFVADVAEGTGAIMTKLCRKSF